MTNYLSSLIFVLLQYGGYAEYAKPKDSTYGFDNESAIKFIIFFLILFAILGLWGWYSIRKSKK